MTWLNKHRDTLSVVMWISVVACIIGGCIYWKHKEESQNSSRLAHKRAIERKAKEEDSQRRREDEVAVEATTEEFAKRYSADKNWTEVINSALPKDKDHDTVTMFTLEIQNAMMGNSPIVFSARIADVFKRADEYYLTAYLFLPVDIDSRDNVPVIEFELECPRDMALQLIQESKTHPVDEDWDIVSVNIIVASISDVARQASENKDISVSLHVDGRDFGVERSYEDSKPYYTGKGKCLAISVPYRAYLD